MKNTRGYTYLLTNGTHYKIGITTKIVTIRVAELQTGSPAKIEISAYSYNSKCEDMERYLHNKFSTKRLMGEWFNLSDDDVAIIHKHFEDNYLDEYYAPLSEKGIIAGIELQKRIDILRIEHAECFMEWQHGLVRQARKGSKVSLEWTLEHLKDDSEAEMIEYIANHKETQVREKLDPKEVEKRKRNEEIMAELRTVQAKCYVDYNTHFCETRGRGKPVSYDWAFNRNIGMTKDELIDSIERLKIKLEKEKRDNEL